MRSIIVMNFACFMMSQCFVCFSSFFVCFGKNKTRMKFNTHHGYLLSTKQTKNLPTLTQRLYSFLSEIKTNDLVKRHLRTFCHGNLFFLSNIIMPSSFIYSSTNFLLALTHVHSLCAMLFFPNPGKIEIRSDR